MVYLSVIVPVYNTSVYLERCLDSLVAQTFRDMEVILVDDGSTDGSGGICDRYAAEYPFVRCIHKCNGGLSSARNAGLDAAAGRYVAFVDSDDFTSPSMFEKLCSASEAGIYDIVYCAIFNAWTSSHGGEVSFSFDEAVCGDSVWKSLADMTASPWDSDIPVVRNMAVWGAIFKRSVIEDNNIRFRSERELMSEDYVFDYELFGFVSAIRYIPDVLYYYCLNGASLSTTFLPSKISSLDSLIAFISTRPVVCGHEGLVPRIIKLDIYYSFVLLTGLVRSSLPVREKNRLIRAIAGRNLWNNPYLAGHLQELGPSFREMIRISRQKNLSVVRLMLLKRKFTSKHRNIYLSPALAPYRVDYYNSIYKECNCDIYFMQKSFSGQLFSTGKLEELCDFPVHFIKSASLSGRLLPFGVAKKIIVSHPEFVVVPEYSITCLWVIFLRFVLFRKFRIISQCDDSYSMIVDGGFSKLHDLARRICIRFVDEVILADSRAVDLMRKRYSKGVWMPIIRDENRFPSYSTLAHRNALPDCLTVLFVGRLSQEKNLGILLEACARLSVPYKLILVGDGPQMSELRQRAVELNVNAEFIGARQGNDLLSWYCAADVFVLPSLMEAFGAVTNEALLCGCPVCVSNRAGSSCLVSEGWNGYTFDPLNAEELKDRIEALGRNGNPSHSSLMPVSYRECFDNCMKECRMLAVHKRY